MQLIPLAVGQSDGALVFWDEHPEIGVVLPRPTQVIHELSWGAGTLDDESCLILYLFIGEQALEVYLKRRLPTSPTEDLDLWQLLCSWQPTLLKLRYGDSPRDQQREVLLLLPKSDGDSLFDKLRQFVVRTQAEWGADAASADPFHDLAAMLRAAEAIEAESVTDGDE